VDSTTISDSATSTLAHGRYGTDYATAGDFPTPRFNRRRINTETLTFSDAATRGFHRIGTATDTTLHSESLSRVRTRVIKITHNQTTRDSAGRKAISIRLVSEFTGGSFYGGLLDYLTRVARLGRQGTDSSSVSDVAAKNKSFASDATENISVSDATAIQANRAAQTSENLSIRDEGDRQLFVIRDGAIVLPTTEQPTSFSKHPRVSVENLVFTDIPVGTRIRPYKPWGPPVPTITSVSRCKVGPDASSDTCVISFEFDRPVDAWCVRVNSHSAVDGILADSWEDASTTLIGTATITADKLRSAVNEVQIYGRAASDGEWTRLHEGDLVTASS
jgi:hypothetical protein